MINSVLNGEIKRDKFKKKKLESTELICQTHNIGHEIEMTLKKATHNKL